jgi:hypothetical protein
MDVRHEPTPIFTPPERDLLPSKETAASFFVAVMGQVSERIRNWLIEIDNFVNVRPNLSAKMFAQQQTERLLSRAAGLSHGLKENLRAFNRAVSARAVNLPTPRLRRRPPMLHDNGKIGMVDH